MRCTHWCAAVAALRIAVATQIFFLLWSSLILDGGNLFKISWIALLLFWSAVGAAALLRAARKTSSPSRTDAIFLAVGYPLLAVFVPILDQILFLSKSR